MSWMRRTWLGACVFVLLGGSAFFLLGFGTERMLATADVCTGRRWRHVAATAATRDHCIGINADGHYRRLPCGRCANECDRKWCQQLPDDVATNTERRALQEDGGSETQYAYEPPSPPPCSPQAEEAGCAMQLCFGYCLQTSDRLFYDPDGECWFGIPQADDDTIATTGTSPETSPESEPTHEAYYDGE